MWVKTSTSTWNKVTDAWVKTAAGSAWSKFWDKPNTPSSINYPYINNYNDTAEIDNVTQISNVGDTIYGHRGTWSNSPTAYLYKWQYSSTENGTYVDFNPSQTSTTHPTPLSTTSWLANNWNGIWIKYAVLASNSAGSSEYSRSSNAAHLVKYSPYVYNVKIQRGGVDVGTTGLVKTGYVLSGIYSETTTSDTVSDTYVYNWKDSLGNILQTSTTQFGGTSYTVQLSDVGKRLIFEVIGTNTGGSVTAYSSTTLAVTAAPTTYSFSMGNTLYLGSNGYIAFDAGYTGTTIPSSGRILNILGGTGSTTKDYQINTYKLWSNSTTYVINVEGYQYNQSAAAYRYAYQVKFYTNQAYADFKITYWGSSLVAPSLGMFQDGALVASGAAGPYAYFAGTTYRVYYNGSQTTSGISFSEISSAAMITQSNLSNYVGNYTSGTYNADDGYFTISTQADQYVSPYVVLGTPTSTSSDISVTFSSTGGDYVGYYYYLRTGSYYGTLVSSGASSASAGSFSASQFSLTLNTSTTYYVTIQPFNSQSQYGSDVQFSQSTTSNPQAFSTVSGTKGFPSGAIQSASQPSGTRNLSVSWNASTGGPNYEVQYEGSSDNSSWTVLQSFAGSTYKTITSDNYSAAYYKYYRFSVRARGADYNVSNAAYSDGGSSSNYVYRTIDGTNPQPPVIGTIIVGTGSSYNTASAAFTITSSPGSNTIDWNQYSLDNSSWVNIYTGPIGLTGLSASTGYYLYMRSLNYDGLYSNSTSQYFQTNAAPVILTAPSIYSVSSGNSSGQAVTAYFSGGSGPYYQIYWTSGVAPTNAVTPDASGSSSPLTDSSGPTSAITYNMYVRSVATAGETSVGPSTIASSWSSAYQFTITQAPITPTITMNANTGVGTGGATINWSSTNQSYAYVDGTYVGNVNSYTFTGKASSTFYSGTVTVYSTTGNTASASYSFTTTTSFTAPSSGAPALQFLRTSGSSRLDWYCDYPGISGNGTITGMDFEIRTTAGGGTLLVSGTRAYPGAGSYPYSAAGNVWAFRMGTANGDISYSASARYGRARVNMLGSNGTTYYGTWSGWI
jgi:hypothetical protein